MRDRYQLPATSFRPERAVTARDDLVRPALAGSWQLEAGSDPSC